VLVDTLLAVVVAVAHQPTELLLMLLAVQVVVVQAVMVVLQIHQ